LRRQAFDSSFILSSFAASPKKKEDEEDASTITLNLSDARARAFALEDCRAAAAEKAARRAKFTPTVFCGSPVKVSGTITYYII
jgi:hypothetical protein